MRRIGDLPHCSGRLAVPCLGPWPAFSAAHTSAGLTLIHVYSYVVEGGMIISGVLEPGS
jgi:hypothetical protein